VLSFRCASPMDLPLVFRLERAYIQNFESEALRAWESAADRHIEQWVSNLSRMYMAEMAGNVVGYYFWEMEIDNAGLSSINVLPDFRRQGIGTALLQHFERNASKEGATLLTLGAIEHNPARHMYEAAGYLFFRKEGSYRYYRKSLAD
jgi:GNAT superfamily N-acetyltransferase